MEVFAMSEDRLFFSKEGTARYISHLDLMRTLQRAFLRAGITIRHTEGFHPHPYVAIPLPLPLGFSSECEVLEFGLVSGAARETLPEKMNLVLPTGITVHRCYEGGKPFRYLTSVRYEVIMEFGRSAAAEAAEAFRELVSRESLLFVKRSKKAKSGQKELDLIPLIFEVTDVTPEGNSLRLNLLLAAQNPGLNPDLLIKAFCREYPSLTPDYVSFRRKEILDEQRKPYL